MFGFQTLYCWHCWLHIPHFTSFYHILPQLNNWRPCEKHIWPSAEAPRDGPGHGPGPMSFGRSVFFRRSHGLFFQGAYVEAEKTCYPLVNIQKAIENHHL